MKAQIIGVFDGQMDVFSTSARVLDDGVIDPRDTRSVLAEVLAICREAEARTPSACNFRSRGHERSDQARRRSTKS
jgi:Acetyl-CoA carboxylase, carboxyltransferase component (subunits alpha and beta)